MITIIYINWSIQITLFSQFLSIWYQRKRDRERERGKRRSLYLCQMNMFSMFYSRSLLELAFMSSVCDSSQINVCVWYEVGVQVVCLFVCFLSDTSTCPSTIYWENHWLSAEVQWHRHICFKVDVFLEPLSYFIAYLCANVTLC